MRHPWLLDTTVVLAVVLFSLPVLLRGDGNAPFGDTTTRDQLTSGALFGCHAALIVPLWWRRKARRSRTS